MTTRKEKRIRWNQLITQLEILETKHHILNDSDITTIHCPGCEICDQIREIGKELAPDEVLPTRDRKQALNKSLTVEEYWAFKAKGITDEAICKKKKVGVKAMSNWKRDNGIKYQMLKGTKKHG